MTAATSEIEHLLREAAPQVLGALARRHRDFAAAEDAVQEALMAAARQWPDEGIPDNPRGWLFRVAVRRLADQVRSELARRRREETVATLSLADAVLAQPAGADVPPEQDDTLLLLFMCCHPALTPASAVALTLRAVGGLTTAEIATAFMVPEATMAQRISRAKAAIRSSGVGFAMPDEAERTARLDAVLHVLYLIFSEGYSASRGAELLRTDLAAEAIRLARTLHSMVPDDGEAAGLLALMLLTHARRDARTGAGGELIPLDEQDRSLWDRALIAEGTSLLERTFPRGAIGAYQLQAAIAAVHDAAPAADATDWARILVLYDLLARIADNPMVELNRAVALAMVEGPEAGLAHIEQLGKDERLKGHYRLDAVRGHLLERAGDHQRALEHYRKAAAHTLSVPERDYLVARAARLTASETAGRRSSSPAQSSPPT